MPLCTPSSSQQPQRLLLFDNTVAIAAVIVAGVVGFGGPFITAIAANRRSKSELKAAGDRQTEALAQERDRLDRQLEAERERLEAQLTAERERLAATHEADRRAARNDAIREVLDAGARLLIAFRSVMGGVEPADVPGHVRAPENLKSVA